MGGYGLAQVSILPSIFWAIWSQLWPIYKDSIPNGEPNMGISCRFFSLAHLSDRTWPGLLAGYGTEFLRLHYTNFEPYAFGVSTWQMRCQILFHSKAMPYTTNMLHSTVIHGHTTAVVSAAAH